MHQNLLDSQRVAIVVLSIVVLASLIINVILFRRLEYLGELMQHCILIAP